MSPEQQRDADQQSALATILHLARSSRNAASADELEYILVNQTHQLIPYRQAAYWSSSNGVCGLSGVVAADKNTPYVQWLQRFFAEVQTRHAAKGDKQPKPMAIHLDSWNSDDTSWSEWLPKMVLVVPIVPRKGVAGGYLMLAREKGFLPVEINFLQEWLDIWQAEYASQKATAQQGSAILSIKQRWQGLSHRGRWIAAIVALLLLFPVRLTVLAPADLIPAQPSYIRAPMDGVVEQLAVIPNQRVASGDELFRFDALSLQNRLALAIRELSTSQAEYRRLAQRALYEADSKAELAVLQSQLNEKQVNVDYLRSLNQRAVVTSPIDGVVLLEDPTQWIGRPVATGEKVMVVANERDVAIEAWLAPGDMIDLPEGADVELFLTNSPLSALQGEVVFISLQPEMRPEGYFAYRVRASLKGEGESTRIGLKGTLKLHGHRVPVIYWMLRRPLASLRAWIGL